MAHLYRKFRLISLICTKFVELKKLNITQFTNIFYLIQIKSYDYSKLNIFDKNSKNFILSKSYNFRTVCSFDSNF